VPRDALTVSRLKQYGTPDVHLPTDTQQKANALIEWGNELHNGGDKLAAAPYYRDAADSYLEFGKYRDAVAA